MKLKIRIDQSIDSVSYKQIEDMIDSWEKRHLESRLSGFGFTNSELSVVINKLKKKGTIYTVKLHMHLPPKKILAAHGEDKEIKIALNEALDRILKEIDRHISRIRRQESYKRKARRMRLRAMEKHLEPMESDFASGTDVQVKDVLPKLERIIKRELIYLQSQGDLPPDYPTVQDVLDEVVTLVKCDWKQGVDSQIILIELLHAMHKVLDDEVRNSRMFGEAVSLEAMPPEDATAQAEEMVGEEVNEFWQPDELLRYEDVIPDDELLIPEDAIQEDEQEINYLFVLLKDLPIYWRRALLMNELEDISVDDLTILFAVRRSEILSWIESANNYLRERLKDAGFTVETNQPLFTLKNRK